MAQFPDPERETGRERSGREGQPSPPLQVTPSVAKPGDVVHIVMLGPPGGLATIDFTPMPPPVPSEREGAGGGRNQ